LRDDHDLLLIGGWLTALERRHLADLTRSEVARALRALSSCYVERRGKLASGGALESAGKRAAFALFYAPLHFLVCREIVRAIPGAAAPAPAEILDIGCGTGAAGAAWALDTGGTARLTGIDRHPWAVAEANWTFRELGLGGRAVQGDAARAKLPSGRRGGIIAAFTVNELPDATRDALLPKLIDAHARGTRVLIVEPIARRLATWWASWQRDFEAAGGHAAEWRFNVPLPALQRQLGRAAGLDPRELTARSLWLP
jgi:SAM-dependent methyltransferase